MALSAASSIQQQYSAGNCTLTLSLQPSALSQWYPQPIVQQVTFKLWMRNAVGEDPQLLAEGDRADLQAIARYINHHTRATLSGQSISQPAEPTRSATSTATAQIAPLLPATVQLPQPLSYLQLCDLTSVLAQYEQSAKTLPVALEAAPSATLKRKNNLILFPRGRRIAWASSAAAALFAVGLTTTIWNSTSSPEPASVAETDLAESQVSGDREERLRLRKPADEDLSAALPRDTPKTATGDSPLPAELERTPASAAPQPSAATQPAPPRSEGASSNRSPTVSPSPNRSVASTEQSASPTSPEDSTVAESPSPPEQTASDSDLNSTNASRDARQESIAQADEPAGFSAEVDVAAPAPAAPVAAARRSPDNALDRRIANTDSETENLSPAALNESELRPQAVAGSRPSERRSSDPAFSDEVEAAIAPQESGIITQVQTYFLGQWDANNSLSEPLSYRLQLSSLGEIVGFSTISEGGEIYRDRLLPDSTITFPPSNSTALPNGIALKVTLLPDGQVQVQKL